jgi:hypothetical protein
MLFLVTSKFTPTLIIKANSREEALADLKSGASPRLLRQIRSNKSLRVVELTTIGLESVLDNLYEKSRREYNPNDFLPDDENPFDGLPNFQIVCDGSF